MDPQAASRSPRSVMRRAPPARPDAETILQSPRAGLPNSYVPFLALGDLYTSRREYKQARPPTPRATPWLLRMPSSWPAA